MEDQDLVILTRADISSRFKNADIITRDYNNGVFYHQMRIKDTYIAIHENMPKEKKYFGRAWFANKEMCEISLDSKEELLDMIDKKVNPMTITKKLKQKAKLFYKTTIQLLWKLKTWLNSKSQNQ